MADFQHIYNKVQAKNAELFSKAKQEYSSLCHDKLQQSQYDGRILGKVVNLLYYESKNSGAGETAETPANVDESSTAIRLINAWKRNPSKLHDVDKLGCESSRPKRATAPKTVAATGHETAVLLCTRREQASPSPNPHTQTPQRQQVTVDIPEAASASYISPDPIPSREAEVNDPDSNMATQEPEQPEDQVPPPCLLHILYSYIWKGNKVRNGGSEMEGGEVGIDFVGDC